MHGARKCCRTCSLARQTRKTIDAALACPTLPVGKREQLLGLSGRLEAAERALEGGGLGFLPGLWPLVWGIALAVTGVLGAGAIKGALEVKRGIENGATRIGDVVPELLDFGVKAVGAILALQLTLSGAALLRRNAS